MMMMMIGCVPFEIHIDWTRREGSCLSSYRESQISVTCYYRPVG